MNLLEFMSDSPWLTFFLAWILAETIVRLINRIMRHINIWKYGYPPVHCDADGDFKKESEE